MDLILIHFLILKFVFSLFLESDDDEGDEDVDEEEGKDNKVDDVKYRHLHSVAWLWSFVSVRGVNGVPQDSVLI